MAVFVSRYANLFTKSSFDIAILVEIKRIIMTIILLCLLINLLLAKLSCIL